MRRKKKKHLHKVSIPEALENRFGSYNRKKIQFLVTSDGDILMRKKKEGRR
ncbi:MAG: hypothetical protein WBD24_01835 [Candidatus Omnitrophota bacterium]